MAQFGIATRCECQLAYEPGYGNVYVCCNEYGYCAYRKSPPMSCKIR